MSDILTTLHDAQDRYGDGATTETGGFERKTDPRDGLLHALWIVLDADGSILIRRGDEPVFPIDMETQCSLIGDALSLGTISIDLATADVAYLNDEARTTQFLIDGTPLRFTYAAGHVDGNIRTHYALQDMVRSVQDGSSSGIMVSIDGVETALGPDDVRLSEEDDDFGAVVLGGLMTYDSLDGPMLDGSGEGPVEGIDFLGRVVRVSRIGSEPARLAA